MVGSCAVAVRELVSHESLVFLTIYDLKTHNANVKPHECPCRVIPAR